jgi:hypothetical protein
LRIPLPILNELHQGGRRHPGNGQFRREKTRDMPEKPVFPSGIRNAPPAVMKIPFLIFLISGLATLQLEPLASCGLELASQYAVRQKKANTRAGALVEAGDQQILCLKEQLADVQLDLMKLLETGRAVSTLLETCEAGLKYDVRAE